MAAETNWPVGAAAAVNRDRPALALVSVAGRKKQVWWSSRGRRGGWARLVVAGASSSGTEGVNVSGEAGRGGGGVVVWMGWAGCNSQVGRSSQKHCSSS